MAYLAFYRTFRPTSFDTVVRQEHIVRILKNQIESGKIGHAYLFCGPRGTGKTTLAKIFARAINCENPQNASPCGKCATCKALAESGNLDISEIDAASNNGVDEMRDLREKVQYPPVAGKYKVYIIDEVHMLTQSAFNAVLKTLEEPPKHAVFILATTEPQKIPATILSRCMRFDFKLIPQKDLEELIKSVLEKTGKPYEDEAVAAIARAGAGSARDSLSIADMCASYSAGKLTYKDVSEVLGSADFIKIAELCGFILAENASSAISYAEEILSTGKSVGVLIKDMLNFMNYLTIEKVCRNSREIINLPEETYKVISDMAKDCDGHKILRVTEILARAETDMRYSTSGRITLETAVLKCAMPQSDYNIDAIIGKINTLQKKLESGGYSRFTPSAETSAHTEGGTPQKSVQPDQPKAQPDRSKAEINQSERETNTPRPDKTPAAAPLQASARVKTGNPVLSEENDLNPFNPFDEPSAEKDGSGSAEQPALWDAVENIAPHGSELTEGDKRTVFAKFIKSLRTTHKNAVLFTLCMDLETVFEGDKLVMFTESEAVYKALNRQDNFRFTGDVLKELGVNLYEIRFKPKGDSDFDKAIKELKDNFGGDIRIK